VVGRVESSKTKPKDTFRRALAEAESVPLLEAIEQGTSKPTTHNVLETQVVCGLVQERPATESVAEHLSSNIPHASDVEEVAEVIAEDTAWLIGLTIKLCLLFGLDSFAYGFMTRSWLVVYFYDTFHVSGAVVGNFLFAASLVASLTVLPSSALCQRVGPLLAIVATKVPASVFAGLIPFGGSATTDFVLLLGRSAADTMDIVPRQVFLSNILPWQFRTRVMGSVNIIKTLGRSIGPVFSGIFAERQKLWVAFLAVAGFEGLFVFLLVLFFFHHSSEKRP
jgi:hypothetical protein